MVENLYRNLSTPTPPTVGAEAGEANPTQVEDFMRELEEEDRDLDTGSEALEHQVSDSKETRERSTIVQPIATRARPSTSGYTPNTSGNMFTNQAQVVGFSEIVGCTFQGEQFFPPKVMGNWMVRETIQNHWFCIVSNHLPYTTNKEIVYNFICNFNPSSQTVYIRGEKYLVTP